MIPPVAPDQVDEVLLALAAIITALGTLLGVVLKMLLDLKQGQRAIKAETAEVVAASRPNSGSSLRDAVDRIEAQTKAMAEAQLVQGAAILRLEGRVDTIADDTHSDIRGLRRDVGRLADDDRADREAAVRAHDEMRKDAARVHDELRGMIARVDQDITAHQHS